jgi:hypothetical protein
VPRASFRLLRRFDKEFERKKLEWSKGEGDRNLKNWYDEKWRELVKAINDTREVADFPSPTDFIINFSVLYDILYYDLKPQGLSLPVQRKVPTQAEKR